MRWAQTGRYASKATWHLADPAAVFELQLSYLRTSQPAVKTGCSTTILQPKWLPEDRRPALARNNVCARCRKRYIDTRPDLKGYLDKLNDRKDV